MNINEQNYVFKTIKCGYPMSQLLKHHWHAILFFPVTAKGLTTAFSPPLRA